MDEVHQQYVVDQNGIRTAVILSIDEYRTLMEDIEELEAIRAYDAAKASADETVPFQQAVEEIENDRK